MNLFVTASRLVPALILSVLWLSGCAERSAFETVNEVDDPVYRRAKDLFGRGMQNEALENYLKLIQKRNGNAPESHLDAGNIYLNHLKDPESAIYYFRKYKALLSREGTPAAKAREGLVDDLIKTARKQFAATLDMKVYQDPLERIKLLDTIQQLREENETLKRQLTETRNRLSGYVAAAPAAASATEVAATPQRVVQATTAPAAPVRPVAAAATAPTGGARTYTIKSGDSLYKIAREVYGDSSRWREILEANRTALPDDRNLKVGTVIVIP